MKKLIATLTAALMLAALTACGENGTTAVGAPSSESTLTASASERAEPTESTDTTVEYNEEDTADILKAMKTKFRSASESIENEKTSITEKIGGDYQQYAQNKDAVAAFYRNSQSTATELYAFTLTAAVDYYKSLAAQGLNDYETWSDALDEFYTAWSGGMDDFYSAWSGAYDEMYEKCSEAIENASDTLKTEEYSDTWSTMYASHSDGWAAMYEAYSAAWSEVYGGYSGVWSGFSSGNTDVDALLKEASEAEKTEPDKTSGTPAPESTIESESNAASSEITAEQQEPASEAEDTASEKSTELVDGMRPEFKEAMDSYEAFYDQYCSFMQKYKANPTDLTLLAEYGSLLAKMEDMDKKFDAWEDDDLNNTEAKYYIEVSSRISQKLIDVAQ